MVEILDLWAKGAPKDEHGPYHPLICHLIDVAAVAEVMWETVPPAARAWFAASLGVDEATAGRWVALWAGLHDVGKSSPAFQNLSQTRAHGAISAVALPDILTAAPFRLPAGLAWRVATVVGGHHGVFPRSGEMDALEHDPKLVGGPAYRRARVELAARLGELLGVPEAPSGTLDNAAAMWLAGIISVADWIGSDSAPDRFPFAASDRAAARALDVASYAEEAIRRARRALATTGWRAWPATTEPRSFRQLFPELTPNELQATAVTVAERLGGPGLTIFEAPMGEGKTEASLYVADYGAATHGLRGHYIALPTRATSDQMFERVKTFLGERYPEDLINAQLLHGHAALSAEAQVRTRFPEPNELYGEPGWDQADAGVVAGEWFTYRKRGLLAPFGVGTVDQALLAALQTRHVFVRLFGLAHKTVIVDEVHAYDVYMSTLLERLLVWLAALGCSVVLLSATLPKSRRAQLVDAYRNGQQAVLRGSPVLLTAEEAGRDWRSVPYPRVTWVETTGQMGAAHVEKLGQSRKKIAVRWLDGAAERALVNLGTQLRAALAEGGCAAVICNTVRRAQEVYLALKDFFPDLADDGEPELDLLHARFLFAERQRREQRALRRFGKPNEETHRPHRAVLVATQVIEQSLDVDFDLMVTELAPADLVLQRAGRLHRHLRQRPPGLERTNLWILGPKVEGDTPEFDRGVTYVYHEHVLLRSWLALRGRETIRVPEEVEELIEAVYDDNRTCPAGANDAFCQQWNDTLQALDGKQEEDVAEAEKRWIKLPTYSGQLWRIAANPREEDAPAFHEEFRALTRLSEETVTVVCLYECADGRCLDAAGREHVRLASRPTIAEAKQLLMHSVSISGRGIVQEFREQTAPSSWRDVGILRHTRLAVFDAAGKRVIGKYQMHLDNELGLRVTRTDAEGEK